MKLYDLMKMSKSDYDAYDTEYDNSVTVCYIGEDEDEADNYDKFCNDIMKKVEVERIIPSSHLVCNWSKLIKDNMEKFKAFTEEHWYKNCQYEDDEDEFIYQWINEIHQYMAGNVSEDFYETLVGFVETLKV